MEHITFEEFSKNIGVIFDRVTKDRATVVVEKEGRLRAVLKPVSATPPRSRRPRTAADFAAAIGAAGSWADVDTDRLLADVYASRAVPPSPPVEL